MKYTPRLRAKYQEEIALNLKSKFEYSSIMQVPRITKICLNQGLGKATGDKKIIDAAVLWRKNSYVPNTFMSLSFQ